MWTYDSATGVIGQNGLFKGRGYSGHGDGLNNSAIQDIEDVGPIPRGKYTIGPFFDDPGGKGPIVCHLVPDPANEMFGRSGFMCHGDNAKGDQSASHGCIILARNLRIAIRDSDDSELEVE